jgi:hypothetical protein
MSGGILSVNEETRRRQTQFHIFRKEMMKLDERNKFGEGGGCLSHGRKKTMII